MCIEHPAKQSCCTRARSAHQLGVGCRTAYGADRMSLVVLGGQDLNTLEDWVRQLFSAVPGAKGPRANFSGLPRPYKARPSMHPFPR